MLGAAPEVAGAVAAVEGGAGLVAANVRVGAREGVALPAAVLGGADRGAAVGRFEADVAAVAPGSLGPAPDPVQAAINAPARIAATDNRRFRLMTWERECMTTLNCRNAEDRAVA